MSRRHWTADEKERLRLLHDTHSRAEIARLMGKSRAGIRQQLIALGLGPEEFESPVKKPSGQLKADYSEEDPRACRRERPWIPPRGTPPLKLPRWW